MGDARERKKAPRDRNHTPSDPQSPYLYLSPTPPPPPPPLATNKQTNKNAAYQVIKLPKNKYTEREKEMLVGCARVPSAFFSGKSGLGFGKIAMVVLIAGVAGVAAWKSRED